MKAERQYKEATSRVIQSKQTAGILNFIDNRQSIIRQMKLMNTISQPQTNKVLQRQLHFTSVNINGIPPLDNDSHAYYHITANLGNTILQSPGYASCVGLAIYRAAIGLNPAMGMLVHFWSGGDVNNYLNNFANDVLDIVNTWSLLTGGFNANDIITIWQGTNPHHLFSQGRWAVFQNYLPQPAVIIPPRASASLDLNTGIVAP